MKFATQVSLKSKYFVIPLPWLRASMFTGFNVDILFFLILKGGNVFLVLSW